MAAAVAHRSTHFATVTAVVGRQTSPTTAASARTSTSGSSAPPRLHRRLPRPRSAPEVKKLADDGKKFCDGFGKGAIIPNPTKYSACEAKLADYQEAIGGHSYVTDANGMNTASLLGDWERNCNSRVQDNIARGGACPMGIDATTISAATDSYLKRDRSKMKHDIMEQRVTDKLAELATYTLQYTAAARLYDATGSTPADTSAPFVMISLGAATVMVVGSAALGLKKFLQNRQTSYSSSAVQDDEDEEEAAGSE